ncbi:MAG: hypothetical protein JWO50_595 [Candidatus Kaiserbacteria bacterium]|nr:hypothetical protein [Candidatus Kaiserbacteria bacterium]
MTQHAIVVVHAASNTVIVGTHSFTDGFKVSRRQWIIRTDEDAVAYCSWLTNHGFAHQSDDFLDRWVERGSIPTIGLPRSAFAT